MGGQHSWASDAVHGPPACRLAAPGVLLPSAAVLNVLKALHASAKSLGTSKAVCKGGLAPRQVPPPAPVPPRPCLFQRGAGPARRSICPGSLQREYGKEIGGLGRAVNAPGSRRVLTGRLPNRSQFAARPLLAVPSWLPHTLHTVPISRPRDHWSSNRACKSGKQQSTGQQVRSGLWGFVELLQSVYSTVWQRAGAGKSLQLAAIAISGPAVLVVLPQSLQTVTVDIWKLFSAGSCGTAAQLGRPASRPPQLRVRCPTRGPAPVQAVHHFGCPIAQATTSDIAAAAAGMERS